MKQTGNTEAVIVSVVRTAIGSFNATFKDISAPELGAVITKAELEKAGVKP
ncbi:acetyl-CoA acetyltransferase [Bacillus methanolicus]|uniref:thiolase family protein n=1 Tax=Bacillus methanolicus TaxID=1471 RepID=UPI00025F1C7C|nr:acetyl-CoA acetyltransferase [Bacillus methanolicus]EIJ83387.1 acetyl-CoA acetyltransferase [Bacillus methanolicus MGA3]